MRRSLVTLAATALLGVAACSGSAATTAPTAAPASTAAPTAAPSVASTAPSVAPASSAATGGVAVAIKNFSFNPATIAAKVGQKITWTNGDDTAHTVTFDDASVTSSGNLNPTFSFDTTIGKAGSFTYHCKIHPTMQGTVTAS